MPQNFKNHTRIAVSFHVFTLVPLIALTVAVIRFVWRAGEEQRELAWILGAMTWVLWGVYYHCRTFPLKTQDRAIRAEEGLRHFVLTGQRLDTRLTLSQIIALRFASDEEFPLLAQRAADEGLSNKAIKQSIRNWRADEHRV